MLLEDQLTAWVTVLDPPQQSLFSYDLATLLNAQLAEGDLDFVFLTEEFRGDSVVMETDSALLVNCSDDVVSLPKLINLAIVD